ncbi:hypothetical protein HY469_01345 [Candidatus Roizmanbacteria bacterium]|nr:hypothetical protein [Candidatus Roizmanbacteria bacterium]
MTNVIYVLIAAIIVLLAAQYVDFPTIIQDEATPQLDVVEPSPTVTPDRCGSEFREYVTDSFSICYPTDLQPLATDSADMVMTFSSEDEELQIGFDPDKKWQIHLCNFEKKVTVASQSAIRTIFNQDSTAGCGRAYRYVTTIKTPDDLLVIDLRKRAGTYPDSQRYETIEQSVQFIDTDELP